MVDDGTGRPLDTVLHPDRRCEILSLVLMAGYVLRAMNRLRTAITGGLNGALVLLELMVAERESRGGPGASAGTAPAAVRARSITSIGLATGLPRETVRRLLAGLAAAGWLEVAEPAAYVTSLQSREWIAAGRGTEALAEFIWVASQLQAVQAARGEAIDTLLEGRPWQSALATHWQAPPHPRVPEAARGLVQRLGDAVGGERERLAHPVDAFLSRHFKRMYRCFEGDLVLPLLIGEIGHRNIAVLAHPRDPERHLRQFGRDPGMRAPETRAGLLRCNTHSLSLATGIAEATVRRKVARLAARGWISVAPDHALTVNGPGVRSHTGAMDAEAMRDLLATYEALCALGVGAEPAAAAGLGSGR